MSLRLASDHTSHFLLTFLSFGPYYVLFTSLHVANKPPPAAAAGAGWWWEGKGHSIVTAQLSPCCPSRSRKNPLMSLAAWLEDIHVSHSLKWWWLGVCLGTLLWKRCTALLRERWALEEPVSAPHTDECGFFPVVKRFVLLLNSRVETCTAVTELNNVFFFFF